MLSSNVVSQNVNTDNMFFLFYTTLIYGIELVHIQTLQEQK